MSLEDLQEKYAALVTERNEKSVAVDTQGLALIKQREETVKNFTKESPEYEAKMTELNSAIEKQRSDRAEILAFDELIKSIKPSELMQVTSIKDFSKFDANNPVTENAVTGITDFNSIIKSSVGRKFFDNVGEDFHSFLQKTGLNKMSVAKNQIKSLDVLSDGSPFQIAGTFNAIFGKNQTERDSAIKSLELDERYNYEGDEKSLTNVVQGRRDAIKSMFTQNPFAGGDGSLFSPTTIFAGNTGGLCEYDIDNSIAELPYAKANFLECIPFENIPKIYRKFVRQTLRINNANSVNETVYAPPVDFIVDKPESQFGFTENMAYTVVFADTVPVSEEFLEECEPVADIVKNQLLMNPLQAFYWQLLNGDGRDGKNPQLVGFFNTAGLSTRIHRGAATYNGVSQIGGGATDDIYDTLELAVFDAEAFGYNVDCALISHQDFIKMAFRRDNDGRRMYTNEQLSRIRGAKIVYDTRVTAGTALVGAFSQVTKALIRRALQFDIGWVNKQFTQDALTLRTRMRAGNMVRQPFALTRISGLF